MLFLIGLGFGVLQTVCLFWSFFLPLEVPLKLPSFFFFLLFLFAGCVFTIMSTCILLFLFFLDEFKSHYLSKKKQKKRYVVVSQWTMLIENHICKNTNDMFFFLISNKILLKRKKSHPRTQGVYKGEQIKNENYKSQVNPKEIKKGFSKQRTIQVMFGKREAWCRG